MRYVGSKAKIWKHLGPVILKDRRPDQVYVEPFVGGGNSIAKVTGPRIGADSNKYMVALLTAIRDGWIPPKTFTREEYRDVRLNKEAHPPELVGFVGGPCSFGGKWFGGYARTTESHDHMGAGHRACLKMKDGLQGVQLHHCDYRDLEIPPNSLIYCDPPYAGTVKYANGFDHDAFWSWVREKSLYHTVFVSEYTAPDDFTCLMEIEHKTTLNQNKPSVRIERLFTAGPRSSS